MWSSMSSENIGEEPLERMPSLGQRLKQGEYFTGAGHLNILVHMRRDIAARVPMLLLTGEEGCGKSVLGGMVAAEIRSGCIPVYCPQTVESFEQLVEQVAASVDIDQTGDGIAEAIECIAAAVAGRNERLLLICDGAERIFLATLERLRKMMDRLNRVVVSMQVVLIGRPLLLDNLRQLDICGFSEIEERHYILQPLTFTETRSYLEFCKTRLPEEERAIFTMETIDRIYRESGGNFKKIHMVAEHLFNRYNKDASFWVLLENVEDGTTKNISGRIGNIFAELQRLVPGNIPRRQQFIYGGAAVLLLILLFLYTLKGNEPEPVVGSVAEIAVATEQVQPERAEKEMALEPASGDDAAERVDDPDLSVEEPVKVTVGKPDQEQSIGMVTEPVEVEEVDSVLDLPVATVVEDGVAEEETPVDSPARRQLQQADLLVEEAQQTVKLARQETGQELVVPSAREAQPESDLVSIKPVPSEHEMPATIVVLPAKIVEKSVPALREHPVSVPMLIPQHLKKITVATDDGTNSRTIAETALRQTGEKYIASVSVPLITASKTKEKKAADSGSATFATQKTLAAEKTIPPGHHGSDIDDIDPIHQMEHVVPSVTKMQGTVGGSKKTPVFGKAIVHEDKQGANSDMYKARVAAGVPWLDGSRDGKYTMQLMALYSDAATANMKNILARRGYVQEAGNLYIFEKQSGVPAVFVFMGEYDTLTEAELARQNIPRELQQNKPYVLSIEEAVQKMK